jgi:dTMP kinase
MLIVLEGLDGSGKTTQTAKLVDWLKATGRDVAMFDFPGYDLSPFGNIIGKYLKGEFCDPVTHDPFASTLLFAGDRLNKRAEINAALREGKFVIINRYVPSNIAYSVAKLRLQNRADEIPRFIKFNEQLEYANILREPMLNFFSRYELLGMPKPDCIIFLDVTPAKAEALINARPTDSRSYLVDQTDHKDKLHVKVF